MTNDSGPSAGFHWCRRKDDAGAEDAYSHVLYWSAAGGLYSGGIDGTRHDPKEWDIGPHITHPDDSGPSAEALAAKRIVDRLALITSATVMPVGQAVQAKVAFTSCEILTKEQVVELIAASLGAFAAQARADVIKRLREPSDALIDAACDGVADPLDRLDCVAVVLRVADHLERETGK